MSKCELDKDWCDWCSVESICCVEGLCDVCKGESDSISWGELAELTHATQVERFGWCGCEDEGTLVYMDCPKREGEE